MDQLMLFGFGIGVFVISTLGTVAALVTVAHQQDEAGRVDDPVARSEPPARSLRVVGGREAA